ncbi:MAG: hypothetical protein RLZZ587_672, partial [Actinomycetota bacterium]
DTGFARVQTVTELRDGTHDSPPLSAARLSAIV